MRKLLLIVLILLCLALPALAEEGETWFDRQFAELVPPGVEARREEKTYALPLADGCTAESLRLTVEGDIRFGRYAQITRTALVDAATGEALELDAVFTDLDALQAFLDAYVEENVLEALNTYLDANDLLPVPLDCVSFDEYGVTFHYPSERFMYFSGHAGAVQLQWYELGDCLLIPPESATLARLRQGDLCGLTLNAPVEELMARYGAMTDPDYVYGGGLIYDFEAPALRGIQAIETGQGRAGILRASRFDLNGIRPGASIAEVMGKLWMPIGIELIDQAAAEDGRLLSGTVISYELAALDGPDETADSSFRLYFDENDTLYLLELCSSDIRRD